MKDLDYLEKRLISLKEECEEICKQYPYYKVNGFWKCQVEGIALRNEISRKLFNVKTNINQTKMRLMNQGEKYDSKRINK